MSLCNCSDHCLPSLGEGTPLLPSWITASEVAYACGMQQPHQLQAVRQVRQMVSQAFRSTSSPFALTSAPCSSSDCAVAIWPSAAATCRGVMACEVTNNVPALQKIMDLMWDHSHPLLAKILYQYRLCRQLWQHTEHADVVKKHRHKIENICNSIPFLQLPFDPIYLKAKIRMYLRANSNCLWVCLLYKHFAWMTKYAITKSYAWVFELQGTQWWKLHISTFVPLWISQEDCYSHWTMIFAYLVVFDSSSVKMSKTVSGLDTRRLVLHNIISL